MVIGWEELAVNPAWLAVQSTGYTDPVFLSLESRLSFRPHLSTKQWNITFGCRLRRDSLVFCWP